MAHALRLHPHVPHVHVRRDARIDAATTTQRADAHWSLAMTSFAIGITAIAVAMAGLSTGRYALHLTALVLGIPGLLLAAWAHTVSDSTNQRWFTVIAMLACGLAAWVSAPGMHLI